MSHGLGQAARAAAAVIALTRLATPAAGILLAAVLIGAAVLCWVISSADRCDRAAQLITAVRGHAAQLAPRPAGQLATTGRKSSRRRRGNGHGKGA